jgi:hypothetical protein
VRTIPHEALPYAAFSPFLRSLHHRRTETTMDEPEPPLHPIYGEPLSGKPRTFAGRVFRPYRVGINRYAWITDDFRLEVRRHETTYTAIVDHRSLKPRFRSDRTAAEAAVKAVS